MGQYLGKKIKNILTPKELKEIDVVIPIPDTSRTSALPLSIELGKKLREGFVKNRYIGRTFIMPGQKIRKKSVKQKLNTIDSEFNGRNSRLDEIQASIINIKLNYLEKENNIRKNIAQIYNNDFLYIIYAIQPE